MDNKLLPCPFCGSEAHIAVYYPGTKQKYYIVECEGCGIQSLPDEPIDLVIFWNNRTTR